MIDGDISLQPHLTVGIDLRLLMQIKYPSLLGFCMKWLPSQSKRFYQMEPMALQMADKLVQKSYNVEFFCLVPQEYAFVFKRMVKRSGLEYHVEFFGNASQLNRHPYDRVLVADQRLAITNSHFEFTAPAYDYSVTTKKWKKFILDSMEFLAAKGFM